MSDVVPIAPGLKLKHVQLVALLHKNPKVREFWRSLDADQRLAAVMGMKEFSADQWIAHQIDRTKLYRSVMRHVIAPDLNIKDVCNPDSDYVFDLIDFRVKNQLSDQYGAITSMSKHNDLSMVFSQIATEQQAYPAAVFLRPMPRHAVVENGLAYGNLRAVLPAGSIISHSDLGMPWEKARHVLLRQEYIITELLDFVHHLLSLMPSKTPMDIRSILSKEGRRAMPQNPFDLASIPAQERLAKLITQCEILQVRGAECLISAKGDELAFRHEVLTMRIPDLIWLVKRDAVEFYECSTSKRQPIPKNGDLYGNIAYHALYHLSMRTATWQYFAMLLKMLPGASKTLREAIAHELASATEALYHELNNELDAVLKVGLLALWRSDLARYVTAQVTNHSVPVDRHMACLLEKKNTSMKYSWKWLRDLTRHYDENPLDTRHLSLNEHAALCRFAELVWFRRALSQVITNFGAKDSDTSVWRQQMPVCCTNCLRASPQVQQNFEPFAGVVSAVCPPLVYDGLYEKFDGSAVESILEGIQNLQVQPTIRKSLQHFKIFQQEGFAQTVVMPKICSDTSTKSSPTLDCEPRVLAAAIKAKIKTRGPSNLVHTHGEDSARAEDQHEHAGDMQLAATGKPSLVRFKVNRRTARTFSMIFDRSQSRGRVTFDSFTSAMSRLGFTVDPRDGSLFMFYPSADMPWDYPFGIHRPHEGHWDGYRLLALAGRLMRSYGWTNDTFERIPPLGEEKI